LAVSEINVLRKCHWLLSHF